MKTVDEMREDIARMRACLLGETDAEMLAALQDMIDELETRVRAVGPTPANLP
jgi:hypothetical protein